MAVLTKEKIVALLPIFQAIAEGKKIRYMGSDYYGETGHSLIFDDHTYCYTIAPESVILWYALIKDKSYKMLSSLTTTRMYTKKEDLIKTYDKNYWEIVEIRSYEVKQ